MNSNIFDEIKNSLNEEDIINFMISLGVQNYENKADYIIFPTICHNEDIESASMKLYYYKSNKLFHCYTDCGESFDIFGLIKRYSKTRNLSASQKKSITRSILNKAKIISGIDFDKTGYVSIKERYEKRTNPKIKVLSDNCLLPFIHYYTQEWLDEGITKKSMDRFNILYSISQNKIIIPHYDIEGNLIGIRGRALDPEDLEKGKYRPITIEDQTFNHPLSLNLYGLNINKNNINQRQFAIVFEGEKSVLLMDSYYPNSTAVATCGSSLHKAQVDLLIKNNVSEIIIAYDKENIGYEKTEEYFNKLYNMCNKYKHYCNFSFVFDREGLLLDKDSPIDRGKDVFERLLNNRIKV